MGPLGLPKWLSLLTKCGCALQAANPENEVAPKAMLACSKLYLSRLSGSPQDMPLHTV